MSLAKILSSLRGAVRICDPYYGTRTLLRLDGLSNCNSVRFLTRNAEQSEKTILPQAIAEFRKERPTFEFRCHRGQELHDRYLIAEEELILLGHGLKDLGGRESFVVRIGSDVAPGMVHDLKALFDEKWEKAAPL